MPRFLYAPTLEQDKTQPTKLSSLHIFKPPTMDFPWPEETALEPYNIFEET